MKIFALIQARMSSLRLPGKVLLEAKGRPLLGYLIERVQKSRELDGVIVATSTAPADDPIAQFCKSGEVKCFRGDLDHVVARFLSAIQANPMDAFVRISADSPWIDPELVDTAVQAFRNGNYDLVTNVLERTFPMGESVEVLNAKMFSDRSKDITSQDDREHVSPYFYRNRDRFRILNLTSSGADCSSVRLSIDTREDFDDFKRMLERLTKPFRDYGWKEIVKLKESLRQPLSL